MYQYHRDYISIIIEIIYLLSLRLCLYYHSDHISIIIEIMYGNSYVPCYMPWDQALMSRSHIYIYIYVYVYIFLEKETCNTKNV